MANCIQPELNMIKKWKGDQRKQRFQAGCFATIIGKIFIKRDKFVAINFLLHIVV